MISVSVLREEESAAWEELVRADPHARRYAGLRYRELLRRLLTGARDAYLVARDGTELVGALPAFLSAAGRHGPVLNALPFYGSHGGIFARDEEARAALLEEFHRL